MLGEVVESARALTGARWGIIATVDEAGAPWEFVFLGFTPEEQLELYTWPDSARLFEHFRGLPAPLWVDDPSDYVRALGIEPPPAFSRTFQGTPMRHRDTDVGSFFLADKADGEAFTDADEKVLTLFAESLRTPGHPHEQLLEVMSIRRADGSEMSLGELPIEQVLRSSETMRAEEVVLSVPDGRSIRVLVNATPIRSDGDAVGSVVVTVQDLAPLDEIERLRTEFLGLVSHELREPLAAIRGSATTLIELASAFPARAGMIRAR